MRRVIIGLLFVAMLLPEVSAQSSSGVLDQYHDRVEAATERGLQYLVSKQEKDGSFVGQYGRATGIPALSGMAFLAKGYTPGGGPYSSNINLCIDYVLRHQDEKGYMGQVGSGQMYSHNIATLFLSEVSGMVDPARQEQLSKAIAKATDVLLKAQQIKKPKQHQGGWRYSPTSTDSDLSCSGWALMALRSARLNGAPVPDKAIEEAVSYIMNNRDKRGGGFGYNGPSSSITLTGAGLLCLELTGHHGEPDTYKAADFIMKNKQHLLPHRHGLYGLYYSSQATFQLGGKHWSTFGKWMYEEWLPRQQEDGAWAEQGKTSAYATAMCLLSLTVPYRQLPIYQRDETVDEEID